MAILAKGILMEEDPAVDKTPPLCLLWWNLSVAVDDGWVWSTTGFDWDKEEDSLERCLLLLLW